MKLFKKLSTYFFTAVFFISVNPKKCDNNWPYPGGDKGFAEVQQTINTPVNKVEITSEIV